MLVTSMSPGWRKSGQLPRCHRKERKAFSARVHHRQVDIAAQCETKCFYTHLARARGRMRFPVTYGHVIIWLRLKRKPKENRNPLDGFREKPEGNHLSLLFLSFFFGGGGSPYFDQNASPGASASAYLLGFVLSSLGRPWPRLPQALGGLKASMLLSEVGNDWHSLRDGKIRKREREREKERNSFWCTRATNRAASPQRLPAREQARDWLRKRHCQPNSEKKTRGGRGETGALLKIAPKEGPGALPKVARKRGRAQAPRSEGTATCPDVVPGKHPQALVAEH